MAEVKRGFRKVTCVIPLAAYESLKRMADGEMRTPDQQGAYLLLKMINPPEQTPGIVDTYDRNGEWDAKEAFAELDKQRDQETSQVE